MEIRVWSSVFLCLLSIATDVLAACFKVCAISSVDAHPTLELFATAGGDNSVKIWSLEPLDEGGIASFRLLATLVNHQQAVNCVRWAGHGRYLASGADDQLVLLYELQEGAPAPVPFGSNARINEQNWTRCATLERHTMGRPWLLSFSKSISLYLCICDGCKSLRDRIKLICCLCFLMH